VTTSPLVPATADRVRSALAAVAELGPFFRLDIHDGRAWPGWEPVRGLGPAGLAGLADSYARQLGTHELRVAVSSLQLSLAARLWSVVTGCALLGGVVPDLSALLLSAGPPIRLGLRHPAGWLVTPTGAADETAGELAATVAAVVGRSLDELTVALPAAPARDLQRGNSASAMTGALGVLARARPGLRVPAAALAAALLQTPDLAGTGTLAAAGPLAGLGLAFRRRSCCLYYRVPAGGLCGDCCFTRPPPAR
jgi:FhuF 2Fe-2S C-terminal domain